MPPRFASCSCGQLNAQVGGEPVRISICHCLACQRRTGSVFGQQARFLRADVQLAGRSAVYVRTGDEGSRIRFHFCPECGSTVYYEPEGLDDFVAIPVGAFADPNFPSPTVSVYEERMPQLGDAAARGGAHPLRTAYGALADCPESVCGHPRQRRTHRSEIRARALQRERRTFFDGRSRTMRALTRILLFTLAVLAWPTTALATSHGEVMPALEQALDQALAAHKTPAVAVVRIVDGRIQGAAARGLRRNDGTQPARLDDAWLIGSSAKPLTVALIARLVDRGRLSWSTPLETLLPELRASMHPDYRGHHPGAAVLASRGLAGKRQRHGLFPALLRRCSTLTSAAAGLCGAGVAGCAGEGTRQRLFL